MKALLGLVMIIGGIVLGLYVGVWWAFVGGIVDIIEQIRAPNLSALAVAWGVAKVVFAGLFGYLSALLLIFPGYYLVESS